jgi:hypothetical protein
MTQLTLVTQQEPDGCVRACLAMIAGVQYEEVPEHCKWGGANAHAWLLLCGIRSKLILTNASPREGSVYIVAVPSLNLANSLHALVWDCRQPQSVLLDPNTGCEGMKAYTSVEDMMRGNQWSLYLEVLMR